ncbi:MAG: hypothetical protein JWQ81_8055 [Amycolatopsis sp.]|jgi:hypothetical protein|uniref:hypothetical protein n=1 Tax=Amycolatopsis sp. TaxID=37632 RepID=UPI0026334EE4|nr:hypothetical protein [Amycolatopsis sp.]MCU1687316.1 hypothetical protein [Amycolatopsis sp.]
MTTEPINPPEGSSWGDTPPAAAPSAKKGWTGRKTAVAVGVAVLIAAGGGVAIAVGTSGSSSASPAQGQGPGGTGGPGGFGGGARGNFGGGAAALVGALHGDFVVANPAGGYLTERLQTGSVTTLSATSITLTSKDGYKQSYTIDSTTKTTGTPKTGDDVTVVAKVSGTTATATTVGEAAQLQAGAGGRRYGGGGQGVPPTDGQGAPPTA